MVAITDIPLQDVDSYDYLIVGGGTAGCVVASRLAEYLPEKRILLIEAGPSDLGDDRILDLTHALDLLGGEFDYEYSTVEQPRGNSNILHSRAKVLGGCSSHNGGLSFRPLEYDCRRWEKLGAKGWSFDMFQRVIDNLRTRIHLCHPRHRNPIVKDWLKACSTAHDIPIIPDFNEEILANKQLNEGAGFLSFSYDPETIYRCSASVAYIHPIFEGRWKRPNLTVLTDAWVSRINAKGDVILGVNITLKSGRKLTLRAKKEVVICAGTIDTPRLLLLSGIGPRKQLEDLSIEVVKDVPGVGENLQDHPETMVLFELNKVVPPNKVVTESDAVIFLRREPENATGDDGRVADLMMHIFTVPFCVNTERLGYDVPENAFAMTPNVPRSRSRGRIYLTSNDGAVKPALDFRYFTDPEGYDEATVVYGIKAARKIAQQAPFSEWIKREIAPGPHITSDEALSKYARSVAHTVYHPCGTTKMGDVKNDPLAVVDPSLKVRGFKNLRIADAGIFPVVTTINPMLTVLGIGERAAELIAEEGGWKGHELSRL